MFGLIPRSKREVGFPMTGLRDEFKTLFDRFFGGWPVLFEPYMEPDYFWGLEVKDVEKEVIVRAEVPGFEPAEVEVEVRDNRLMIRAEKKPATPDKKSPEYARARYERFVELPVPIVSEKASAIYRNGVLEVHLPKAEEAAVRRIPVK